VPISSMVRGSLTLALLICTSTVSAAAEDGASDVRVQLIARNTTVLSSEIAGNILQLPVREGESFREGEELVAIDCAAYRARLAQMDAQVNRAARKLEAQRLLDKRAAIGKAELDLAEIDLDAARAEQELAALDVSRCSIKAPFSGRVAERKMQGFQYVTVGQPIIDILSDRDLELEMLAPSRFLSWLKPGATFVLRIDELGRDFPAAVTRVGPRIDPVSQAVKIYGRIQGEFADLVPGMSGIARLAPRAETALRP
jgi:membrane fusion protein (multidrug efflux system)